MPATAASKTKPKAKVGLIYVPILLHKTIGKMAIDMDQTRQKIAARALEIGLAQIKGESASQS